MACALFVPILSLFRLFGTNGPITIVGMRLLKSVIVKMTMRHSTLGDKPNS